MDKTGRPNNKSESQRSEKDFFPDPFFSPHFATSSHNGRNFSKTKTEENKRNNLKIEENKS